MNNSFNKVYVKEGRITPKYKGYFVSFWKKVDGKNTPYNEEEVKELIVKTQDGYISVSKEYLLKNKILSNDKVKGKLGFRIKEGDEVLVLKTEKEIKSLYGNILDFKNMNNSSKNQDKDNNKLVKETLKLGVDAIGVVQKEINLNLYGLEIEYSPKILYNDIQVLWKKLNGLKKEKEIKISYPWKKYGIIYKKDNLYYYFCGFEISNDLKNIDEYINYKVDISKYVKFKHKGNMYKLKGEYKENFKVLKKNNINYLNNPLLIEEYGEKFKWNDENSIINILIPIK